VSGRYISLTRSGVLVPERIKASYEGAAEGRRSSNWDAPDTGPNSLIMPALRNLRSRSRAAVRNDPYAANVIDKRVSNLIGTGITPQPRLTDKALRKIMQVLWEDWVDESDADELTDFYGQQALVARTVEQSGECFVRLRPRRLEDGLAVPLQLQCLSPEFVPHDKFEVTRSGNVIRAGIEFNSIGRRVAYWCYRNHPSDKTSLNAGWSTAGRSPVGAGTKAVAQPGQLRRRGPISSGSGQPVRRLHPQACTGRPAADGHGDRGTRQLRPRRFHADGGAGTRHDAGVAAG